MCYRAASEKTTDELGPERKFWKDERNEEEQAEGHFISSQTETTPNFVTTYIE
jgi:hypothetical protein